MKKRIFLALAVISVFLFCSCNGNGKVTLKADGAVAFEFTGSVGDAVKEMMTSAGSDLSSVDEEGIVTALEESGFTNAYAKVDMKNNIIRFSFEDKDRSSFLFDSEIVKIKDNNEVVFNITAPKFLHLYNLAGEDIQMLLDIFLSPVLNDEEMTEEDYIDTLSVTYGEDVGKEIDESSIVFTVINKDGTKKTDSIFAKSILCGAEISL